MVEKTRSVRLPAASPRGPMSLEEAIARRRSVRSFLPDPIPHPAVAQLLWAAQGITNPASGYRSAPSAGATFPLVAYAVTGEGVFRYEPSQHALVQTGSEDVRNLLCAAALGQDFVRQAPLSIVLAARHGLTTSVYGKRGERYVAMEAGHAAQNVHLQAVALGLGSVPIGAYDDDRLGRTLGLPGDVVPLYIIPIGRPR